MVCVLTMTLVANKSFEKEFDHVILLQPEYVQITLREYNLLTKLLGRSTLK